jgi:hypothetical protein
MIAIVSTASPSVVVHVRIDREESVGIRRDADRARVFLRTAISGAPDVEAAAAVD